MYSDPVQLELALAECRRQLNPKFKTIAAKYQVDRSTLSRRFRGVQRSYIESRSESIQCLTLAQEEVLIGFINRLTDRALPPTSQIVKNVAEELSSKQGVHTPRLRLLKH
jgi:hypothetical protein